MSTIGQERSQYPDGHPAVQNTGGQLSLSPDDWMLIQPWRLGTMIRGHACIVCDPPDQIPRSSYRDFLISCHGGLWILGGRSEDFCRHLIDLHNRAIGFPDAVPSRDAEVA